MSLLLDTHILLWWLADDPQLGQAARDRITDPAQRVLVSAASIWEIGIKQAIGKLKVPEPILQAIQDGGFEELTITGHHAELAACLPEHHKDPFGRMLIAQAKLEGLILVTADSAIHAYDVTILKA